MIFYRNSYKKTKNKSYSSLLKLLMPSLNIVKILLIWLLRKYEKSNYSWFLTPGEKMNIKNITEHYQISKTYSFGHIVLL